MNDSNNNREYLFFVSDILENDEFNKLNLMKHHGISRMEHSKRVSYYSYLVTKFLRLNYESAARAGLLHDFFLNDIDIKLKDKFLSTFIHPKYAIINSKKYFEISELETNIIESHMFPIYKKLPKYAESWIVSIVDKMVAIYEFGKVFGMKFSYASNLFIILILNNMR